MISKAPRNLVLSDEVLDYSHLYRNFYDIFVGHNNDTKGFDLNFAVRECRNINANFVNLMENNLMLAGKHKFDKHPLEKGYKDFSGAGNHLTLVGSHLNQLEAMM